MSNMLSLNQEKLIRSLATKKGRTESGFCLVEGEKNVLEAGDLVEFTFTPNDSKDFASLVETVTPQPIVAVARIPVHTKEEILKSDIIVVLDGVQDPGNVGTILRLCLGFDAALVLIESADPSNSKVIRSSAGAFFKTPWLEIPRPGAEAELLSYGREIYRLEGEGKSEVISFNSKNLSTLPKKLLLVAGSEGHGIKLEVAGTSLTIPHSDKLESLNVANALAIVLAGLYTKD
jgi:TrmH family RNA methyltransferase